MEIIPYLCSVFQFESAVKISKKPDMTKEIHISHGKRAKLMKALNVTYPTVRAALRFESNTIIAEKIRKVAQSEYGGTIYEASAGINLQKR